jgi:hypothetical protein
MIRSGFSSISNMILTNISGQEKTARILDGGSRAAVGEGRKPGRMQPLKTNLTHFERNANKMSQKSDTELEQCYGKHCLDCPEDACNLREAGLNVIAEKREVLSIHNGTNHRVYIDAVAHWDDLSEMAGNLRLRNSGGDCAWLAGVYADLFKALASGDENDKSENAGIIASAPSADAMRFAAESLRRLFWLLEEKPVTTMVLLRKVFLDENQAEQARSRKISRQAINKQVRGDLAGIAELLGLRIPVAAKEAKLLELTPEEFGVYKVCFQDGCTVRSAAVQLKMSPAKVHRLKQKVSSKLQKNGTRKKRESTKKQKNKKVNEK